MESSNVLWIRMSLAINSWFIVDALDLVAQLIASLSFVYNISLVR